MSWSPMSREARRSSREGQHPFLAIVSCLFFQGALWEPFLMIRSPAARKEVLASVMLEETQDHGSVFSERRCCCRFNVRGSRTAAPSRAGCIPGPLQDQGAVATGMIQQPLGTCTLSFTLICNSFSLHKVLDSKNCLYRENFWNSLSSICCIRI